MYEVIDIYPIGNNLAVTLQGLCNDIKIDSKLQDSEGNMYTVVSVGMVGFSEVENVLKSTEVLVQPNTMTKGTRIRVLD